MSAFTPSGRASALGILYSSRESTTALYGIGLLGVPRPSLADYVRGPAATRAATAAAACACCLGSEGRTQVITIHPPLPETGSEGGEDLDAPC